MSDPTNRGVQVFNGRIHLDRDPIEVEGALLKCSCEKLMLFGASTGQVSGTITCDACGTQLWPLELEELFSVPMIEVVI